MSGPGEFEFTEANRVERLVLERLRGRPALLIVEGPAGCGKSHLRGRLRFRLAGEFRQIDLPYSRLSYEQLIAILGAQAPADPAPRPALSRPRTALTGAPPTLLVVDDLHCMPGETLEKLCELVAARPGGSLKVLGFGKPGYYDRHAEHLEGRLGPAGVVRLPLPGPSRQEREAMVRTLVGAAPANRAQPLDEAVLTLVRLAGGNLRLVRTLVEHTLIEARLRNLTLIDATLVEEIGATFDLPARTQEPAPPERPPRRGGGWRQVGTALVLTAALLAGLGLAPWSLPPLLGEPDSPAPAPASRQRVEPPRPLSILVQNSSAGSRTVADFVLRLLELAREHERAFRLTIPERDNAVIRYRQIQAVDPGNATARQAIERIERLYLRRAQRAERSGDRALARHNYSRLLWIDPDNRLARDHLNALEGTPLALGARP